MSDRLASHVSDLQAPTFVRWTVRKSNRGTVVLILRDQVGTAMVWAELSPEESWQMAKHLNDTGDLC